MKRRPAGRRWLRWVLPIAVLAILLGGGAFAALESDVVESYWEGVWWALTLMATVGFVNTPHTVLGKLVAAIISLMGFGLLALVTASISSLFVREDEVPQEERERAFEQLILKELGDLRSRLERIERATQR